MLRLHPSALDYGILAIYFVVVLGIGPVAPEPPETRGEGSGRIRRAPAT